MTEDNVMEFCQWLVSEKGIEAGNLSDYINNNEEEVLKLAEEFKKPKFKVGGKVEAAAEMFKCGGKTKKTKKTKKAQNGAVLKSFKSLPYGRSSADLAVLPNDLNKNKADSLITVPADFGGEYTLIKDGITGKIRGNHQSEMSGIKQMDTKKAYQMFRKFADMFNRPIEKHEDGNKINRIGITSGIVKAQGGEKVYNTGEIRADDRTKLGRWWDKVKTNYRNSN